MKKIATNQINQIKKNNQNSNRLDMYSTSPNSLRNGNDLHSRRSNSKDSIDSLIFSSDEER